MSREASLIPSFQTLSKNDVCISWPVLAPMVAYGSSANTIADYLVKVTSAPLTAFATPQNPE